MANNITALQEANNIVDWLGVFNSATNNWYVLLFILVGIVILTVWQLRNQRTLSFSLLISLTGFFIPVLFFRSMTYQGVPLIDDGWVALHIALIAILAIVEYNNKR